MTTAIRTLAVFAAGITYALAIANLIVSFRVLRPIPFSWRNFAGSGGGFIWMHIVCVVIPFQGFVTWGIVEVVTRVGSPMTFRPWALLSFCLLINLGYVIIFRVELARLRLRDAVKADL